MSHQPGNAGDAAALILGFLWYLIGLFVLAFAHSTLPGLGAGVALTAFGAALAYSGRSR